MIGGGFRICHGAVTAADPFIVENQTSVKAPPLIRTPLQIGFRKQPQGISLAPLETVGIEGHFIGSVGDHLRLLGIGLADWRFSLGQIRWFTEI